MSDFNTDEKMFSISNEEQSLENNINKASKVEAKEEPVLEDVDLQEDPQDTTPYKIEPEVEARPEPSKTIAELAAIAKEGGSTSAANQQKAEQFSTGVNNNIRSKVQNASSEVVEEVEELGSQLGRDLLDEDKLRNLDINQNYEKVMISLNEQLARNDEEILAEIQDAKKQKGFQVLVVAGINVLAQLYAAEKGLEYKADQGISQQLRQDLNDKIDLIRTKRKLLVDRIAGAKSLVDKVYQSQRQDRKLEDAQERAARIAEDKEKLREEKATLTSEYEKQAYQSQLEAKKRQFFTKFEGLSSSKKKEMLIGFGKTEEEAEKLLGIDQGFLGVFDTDSDLEGIRTALEAQALAEVKKPRSMLRPSTETAPVIPEGNTVPTLVRSEISPDGLTKTDYYSDGTKKVFRKKQ